MIKLPRTAGSAFIGQLSLAPDGKIYVAVDGTYYLGVINNPNSAGTLCNFNTEGFYLSNRLSGLGLPNFISSYNDTFCSTALNLGEDRNLCLNESVILQKACNDCDYLWSDGSRNNSLRVDEPGLYWLEVSNKTCTSRDSITFEAPLPLFANFDDDTTLCASQKLLLKVTQQGSTFLWSDGSTGSELEVSTSGDYWVDVFNGECQTRIPVHANFKDFAPLNLGADAIVCSPGILKLTVNETWGQILWNNNTTEKSLTIESTGTYWAEMSSDYCYARDSIHVEFKDSPSINLGGDIKLCLGETIILDASFPFCNYLWSNSATTPTMEVSEPGFYSVVVTSPDSHCSSSAAVTVTYEECLDDLFIPNVITPNGDDKNDFFEISGAEGTHWDLIIYNRWGTQIFQSIDYSDDWNGNSHATGTYYYSLTSQYSGRNFMGWVELKK
jgi:gliding motility-associated-like protein